jgi:enamine deaminase RidA (YjgF/YER057c/UK114 family)
MLVRSWNVEEEMTGEVEARLAELGVELPEPSTPAANYVPFVVSGNQVFIAGQIPFWNGEVKFRGIVGQDFDVEEAQDAARTCALNLLAQLKVACNGNLDRVRRCVKLGVFVNCPAGYDRQPEIANGASDLMVEVFGDAGRHARFAVGAGSLPRNVAVEVDGIFEIG